jgi:hydroxyacylglutathione hydrolase
MLTIFPIPAIRDNYIWALHDGRHAVIVCPGEAAPVHAWLKATGITLTAILNTHHHWDHINGIVELAQVYNVPVYGPRHEDIPGMTRARGEGDVIEFSAPACRLRVMEIPGHTRGHIAYLGEGTGVPHPHLTPPLEGEEAGSSPLQGEGGGLHNNFLFCGDTLFGGGCGRVFPGGDVKKFHASLRRLAALPDATRVFCAHEYTETNLRFALECEPNNVALQARQASVLALRAEGLPTLPSTIALEKATNPFLRCDQPEIIRNVEAHSGEVLPAHDSETVFIALREWKNGWRG